MLLELPFGLQITEHNFTFLFDFSRKSQQQSKISHLQLLLFFFGGKQQQQQFPVSVLPKTFLCRCFFFSWGDAQHRTCAVREIDIFW